MLSSTHNTKIASGLLYELIQEQRVTPSVELSSYLRFLPGAFSQIGITEQSAPFCTTDCMLIVTGMVSGGSKRRISAVLGMPTELVTSRTAVPRYIIAEDGTLAGVGNDESGLLSISEAFLVFAGAIRVSSRRRRKIGLLLLDTGIVPETAREASSVFFRLR